MTYEKSLWREKFTKLSFMFEGKQAIVVLPEKTCGRWMLKTEYFDAFQDFECELVKRGYTLAYLQNGSRLVKEGDLERKKRFADFLINEFNLADKCVPVGMSCGGLHAIRQASAYPEMISVLCLDAPVVNLLSWPFHMSDRTTFCSEGAEKEVFDALGLTRTTILTYRDHPFDHIPDLLKAKIPMLLTYGDADGEVPFSENGILLAEAYDKTDIPHLVMGTPGRGHHPHGPNGDIAMQRAIEFVLRYDK